MLSNEMKQKVRRLFHAESLPVGTIARMLGLHHSTVRRAILHDGVPLVAIPSRLLKNGVSETSPNPHLRPW